MEGKKKVVLPMRSLGSLARQLRRGSEIRKKIIKKKAGNEEQKKTRFIRDGRKHLLAETTAREGKLRWTQRLRTIRKLVPKPNKVPIKPGSVVAQEYDNLAHDNVEENPTQRHLDWDSKEAVVRVGERELIFSEKGQRRGVELDENDIVQHTSQLQQSDLIAGVDTQTKAKVFDMLLPNQGGFVPAYSPSGRILALASKRGASLSAVVWRSFDLVFEARNFLGGGKAVSSVCWMMEDALLAVAFKGGKTRIYDDQGAELHLVHAFREVEFLEYLTFHFLLVGGAPNAGRVTFLDVSIGSVIATVNLPRFTCMCQNPHNALICVGHTNGTVSFVSPRDKDNEPLCSILCHKAPVSQVVVTVDGKFLVTFSLTEQKLKVWNLSTMACMRDVDFNEFADFFCVSQTGMLAFAVGGEVRVYRHISDVNQAQPYLKHSVPDSSTGLKVTGLRFCPFEDVLAVGWTGGFSSILIPGSGYVDFDSRVPNPFFNDKQIKDFNVNTLVEKLPPDTICWDPQMIGSSGGLKADTLKVKKEIKEKLKLIDFQVKEKEAKAGGELKDSFFNLAKHERRQMIDDAVDDSEKLAEKRLKKWFEEEEEEQDPLKRFLSKEELLKREVAKIEKEKKDDLSASHVARAVPVPKRKREDEDDSKGGKRRKTVVQKKKE